MDNANKHPWDTPLESRREEFYKAKAAGKKCVLFLYEKSDASTFRYRAYNVAQRLQHNAEWSLHYFFALDELEHLQAMPTDADMVILCRVKWTYALDLLISKAQARGIPVVYDSDDLIFDLDYLPQALSTLSVLSQDSAQREMDLTLWVSLFGRNYMTASRADGFITTNDYLGEKLTAKFGKPYQVIHNSINDEQLQVSAAAVTQKSANKDRFVIGYFSGTPSHVNDFSAVAPELQLFLTEHKDALLRVVGYMEFPDYLQPFVENGQIERIPPVSYLRLQELVAQVDVNIVPLVENQFTNCKSELKYFEAAIVRTPTIATPTYAYKTAIRHGHNGFLCRVGQWYDTLQAIYDGRVDLSSILDNAYSHAMETYSGTAIYNEIEQAFNFFTNKD